MRKLLVSFITAVTVLTNSVSSYAAVALPNQFVDIDNHWAEAELTEMIQLDILSGYAENGKYFAKPNKPITRVEFAALMAKTLRLEATSQQPDFADWQQIPAWAKGAVASLSANGIINGVPGSDGRTYFQPHKNITRAEIAAMIMNAVQSPPQPPYDANFKDVPLNKWYATSVLQAKKAGIIGGRTATTFEPNRNATRAEVLVILNRFLKTDSTATPTDGQLQNVIDGYLADLETVMQRDNKLTELTHYTTGGATLSLKNGGLGAVEDSPTSLNISSISRIGGFDVKFKNNHLATVVVKVKYTLNQANSQQQNITVTERFGLTNIKGAWKIYKVDVLDY
ncbi:S-layer homology domain-containing protein [Peptococcaceae bacterium 1198_IL3148]